MYKLLNQLEKISYEKLNIDEILDQREVFSFDSEWVRVYQTIEQLKKGKDVNDSTDIQKKAFIMVYEQTASDELAGYISDDFGLIADSQTLNYSDEWLNKLISCYEKSMIPCGEL